MKNQSKNRILIIMTIVISSIFFATSCSNIKKSTKSNKQNSKVESSVDIPVAEQKDKSSIDILTTEEIIANLCSDEFEGRYTFSNGNEKAGEYIADTFSKIGLEPLSEDSYFQPYTQTRGYSDDYNASGTTQNIVGYIKGKDSEKAIVISAHFDGRGIREGKIYRSALDNASGVATLMEIAKNLKQVSEENPFESNIIFCAFNGEEQLYCGSSAFINQAKSQLWYKNMYNINIDCIGAEDGGKLTFPNDSQCSGKLYEAIKNSMKKNNIDLVETEQILGSDHRSFEKAQKANINICQENLRKLIHKPTDTPDILDCTQIEKIANVLSDFVKNNDGIVF